MAQAADFHSNLATPRQRSIGLLEDLETPLVAIDLGRAEQNIRKLQDYCDRHGLLNRPHIKTHKLPMLAHKQCTAGASGVTVQTLGEAEVMVAAGISDILITYNLIGEQKALRLARLARNASIRVAVDNEVALATIGRASDLAGRSIGVLIEFESGKLRQGVLEVEDALLLARKVDSFDHLQFLGLLTYPSSPRVPDWVTEAKTQFSAAGVPLHVISAGGTPQMWRAHEIQGLTEYRAGTYVYFDRRSVASGSATLDECALHVHVTLVSKPTPSRGIIDAGSKVLTSDTMPANVGSGHGLILEYPGAVISELSEEHGVVDFSRCEATPSIGDRLRVLPNHVCPVSNLVDNVALHRNGEIEAVVPVAARGKR